MQPNRTRHIIRKIFKILAWILVSIITLILLILILIQLPSVQNFGRKKIVSFLEKKIGTPVQIAHLDIDFPKLIVLEGVYFQDQQQDTLLYGKKLRVDISLFKLIKNHVEINEISLDGITAKIDRDSTGIFNFDYIINAFASEPKVEDTTSSSMEISLGDINLDKINIKYHDDFMGYDMALALNHFDTEIKTFDPEESNYETDDLTLEGLTTSLRQYKPLGEKITQINSSITPDSIKSVPVNLKLGNIDLTKIKIDYQNEIDSLFTNVNLGKLHISPDNLDLDGEKVTVNELLLQNTRADIYLGHNETAKQVAESVARASDSVGSKMQQEGWIVVLDKVVLKNNSFVYNDNNTPPIPRGMDYSHLDLENLHLDASSIYYRPDSISGTIEDFGFKDKSGVQVNQLETDFLYTDNQAYLKDLNLETPNTKLQKSLILHYPSIAAITENIGLLEIDADLRGSVIGLKDILYFVPDLGSQPLFTKFPNGKFQTDVVLKGSVNNLDIPRFELSGLKGTHVSLSGHISQITDPKHFYANLSIPDISTTNDDIYAMAPKGSLPSNIRIPANIALRGNLKGNMDRLETDLGLRSSLGNANVKGTITNATDSIRARYNASINLDRFNAGSLLKQEDQFGSISLNANVEGIGYAPSKMAAELNGIVTSAEIKGYTYKDLKFDGSGAQGLYELTAGITDPNIDLNLVASANLLGAAPAIQATVMVDSISLQPLNFASEDLRIHTKIIADIPNLDIDNLQGKVLVTQLLVNTGKQRFISDTVSINATSSEGINAITVNSPVLLAGLRGKYTLSGIGTAFQQIIDRYYDLGPVPTERLPPQVADFYAQVYNSRFLRELMPTLSLTDTLTFRGNINSPAASIDVNGVIPALSYGSYHIGQGAVALNTTDSAINYAVTIDKVSSTSLDIPHIKMAGNVANNNIAYNLSVTDDDKKEKYLVAGNLLQQNENFVLSLLPGGLKLDYDNWNVNPQNKIEFGKNGIKATAFEISSDNQVLKIQSESPAYNAPLTATFSNFKIESLTKIAEQDSLFMGGTLNGNATVSNLEASPLFDANLTVNNFNYKEDTLGDIVIKANNKTADSYTADVTITGNGNTVNANGIYYAAGNFDFDVNIQTLNLASIESFTQGNLRQMDGDMTGRMKITGTAANPKINGNINFNNASMNVTMLNALFRMNDERITFQDDGIHFNKFTIRDSSNNTAVIDGAVYTTDYSDYRFNLDINADNFQVVSSKKKDNNLYYGDLFIDTRITVRGDMNKPVVNADLSVNDKTDLTIVLPQTDPQVAAREGIVEFFDQDFPQLDSMLLSEYDTLNTSDIKGLDLVANITISEKAQFSMIIDEANGDFIRLMGEGNLSGGIDPSGKVSLTGTYEINEGGYEMSFNMLRRKFSIQKGSSLTWTGEPTSANVNITAVYIANAPPIDLVEQQIADASETIKNTYKQKLPFNVLLTMTGELLQPELTFDIILPEKNYSVSTDIVNASRTRLQQIRQEPSELNKQVFALLLLGRFVAENPFSSGGGSTSATTLAKQSVSRLLSEQLNKLAADLISGVDINFGLETTEDYTTGTQQDRTDLNVGVSKRLLNDRLKVSVGSNFELEGPTQTKQKTSNIAGNIQIDYQLNKEGSLLLRGYRTDQYEVALQGQVVETGLTFILNLEYDKLKEILNRKKKKEIKEQVKKEQERLGTGKKEDETELNN